MEGEDEEREEATDEGKISKIRFKSDNEDDRERRETGLERDARKRKQQEREEKEKRAREQGMEAEEVRDWIDDDKMYPEANSSKPGAKK